MNIVTIHHGNESVSINLDELDGYVKGTLALHEINKKNLLNAVRHWLMIIQQVTEDLNHEPTENVH